MNSESPNRPPVSRLSAEPDMETLEQEEHQRLEEFQRQFESLEGRDLQLWSIVILILLLTAAALASLVLPNVMWGLGTLHLEGRYLPQLFFGFIALVVLFNIYVIDQRRQLRETRAELMRQIARRETAERLALVDPLTGVFNRRYLDHLISKEANRANRFGTNLTFLMIDVDEFKAVNSRFGHAEGDRFLKEVAQLLRRTFRGLDTIFRYGGDEFLVVLPEADESQAQLAIERLRQHMDDWNRANTALGYRMQLSCGVAGYTKGAEVVDVLQMADYRMYLQKGQRAAPARN